MASTADGSAAAPEAMVGTVGSSGVEAGVVNDASESGVAKPVAPKEQTAPLEASQGMVRLTILPRSPPVVPRAMAEEDEVEEIERAEPRPQSI